MLIKNLRLLIGLAPLACLGCTSDTTSICQMPANRHFWQGADVQWRGEIVDISAPPHGSVIVFTDYQCGANVELDRDIVPTLYSDNDWDRHSAVANFEVAGRLSYRDGDVVLVPRSLKRTSPWAVDDAFYAYMDKRYATLTEKGIIKPLTK